MVDIINSGKPKTVQFDVVDYDGENVSDTFDSADYRLIDEKGADLIPWTALPDSGNPESIEVVVDASNNQLADVRRGYRRVELRINFNTVNESVQFYEYILVNVYEKPLLVGDNSYQTYGTALVRSYDLANLDHFRGATREDQIVAMSNAYRMIGTVPFAVGGYSLPPVSTLTETQMNTLDTRFLEALMDVQLIEANETLNPNSIHQKRVEGLMAESIGESSMMFRPEKVLANKLVTRRSIAILRPWIDWSVPIGRA